MPGEASTRAGRAQDRLTSLPRRQADTRDRVTHGADGGLAGHRAGQLGQAVGPGSSAGQWGAGQAAASDSEGAR